MRTCKYCGETASTYSSLQSHRIEEHMVRVGPFELTSNQLFAFITMFMMTVVAIMLVAIFIISQDYLYGSLIVLFWVLFNRSNFVFLSQQPDMERNQLKLTDFTDN